MFRQIRVHPEDCNLHRIVWGKSPSEVIQEYKLLTVTYSTTSAPYLAIRTLIQLAKEESNRYPEGSRVLMHDTYVDDILTGADSIEAALLFKNQVIALLKSGGFALHKWSSNCNTLLLTEESEHLGSVGFADKEQSSAKTLGVLWYPASDSFVFQVSFPKVPIVIIKRTILSDVAKIFDPLVFLSPATLLAAGWIKLRQELNQLRDIVIPIWTNTTTQVTWELHAIYLKSTLGIKSSNVTLLCAKTKLAPIKTLSTSRLELMGVLLMARLVKRVSEVMNPKKFQVFCWTNSMKVLAWLSSHPSKWKSFVSNRCTLIHDLIPNAKWRYVPGSMNPSDSSSQGVHPAKLLVLDLWWKGPHWFKLAESEWPTKSMHESTSEDVTIEERPVAIQTTVT